MIFLYGPKAMTEEIAALLGEPSQVVDAFTELGLRSGDLILCDHSALGEAPRSSPVVAVGPPDQAGLRSALDAGACDYLTQPIQRLDLVRAIIQARRWAIPRLALEPSAIAARVLHELNNPLQSLIFCADSLSRLFEAKDCESAYADVEELRDAVDQLRLIARAGGTLLTRSDAPGDIAEAVATVRLLMGRRRMLDAHLDDALPAVRVPTAMLAQILLNLVVHAMKQGGHNLSLHVSTRDEAVHMALHDEGAGVGSELLRDALEGRLGQRPDHDQGLGRVPEVIRFFGGRIEMPSRSGGTTQLGLVFMPAG